MKRSLAALAAVTALVALNGCSSAIRSPAAQPRAEPSTGSTSSATTAPSGEDTAITITAGDRTFDATINDSDVSKDLLATLPTTLTWDRSGTIEYITELDAPLTETGPFYTDVKAGDIVYFNPRDSITIIYAPTVSVPTLTKMGQVTSELAAFEDLPDTVDLRLERK